MGQRTQRLIWRIEALAYDALSFAIRLLPFPALSAVGGKLLRMIGPLTRKHHIARTNIEIAFPDLSDLSLIHI